MGKFLCHCGYLISDSVYPCELTGEMKWEPESESADQEALRASASFLSAIEEGRKNEWIHDYFNGPYPLDLSVAVIISDIYSKEFGKQGRCIYRCPECERLYLQKEFYSDDWICYEKAPG